MTNQNTSEITIRRAIGSDLETIVDFNSAMARETEGKTLDLGRLRPGVAAVLADGGWGFYLLAEIAGQVAGQLMITTEWSDWRNAYFWWIQSVYVIPEHRRRGVYRALDQQVRAQARLRGNVCGVRLYVDRRNHGAQKVYSSLGMCPSHYDMYEVEISE
ncbi:MAG: GNAT family N-acetyltransferase [Chloroflexi bacterium]|nr:GNAT family N-acetyltransferase [Chloroflexota bacterium]